jgi:hypothetical protein
MASIVVVEVDRWDARELKGGEEGVIHSAGIVKDCTHNSLGASDLLMGCWRGFIWQRGILNDVAIRWGRPVMRGIFWTFGHGVLVRMQCIFVISWHGNVNMHVFIVIFQCNSAV